MHLGSGNEQTVSVSTAERSCFSSGEIQTLMSVDGDRVVNLCASVHELWSLPLQMAVALGLLYMQVKFAFLAGLAVIILLIPVNRVIALKISASSDLMMKEKDERVRKMGELLVYMRTIKMYAWEHFFVGRILQSRNQELKQLSVYSEVS
jgi:ATP-binding cassette subfamily C (CFTR/MRP) protein 10